MRYRRRRIQSRFGVVTAAALLGSTLTGAAVAAPPPARDIAGTQPADDRVVTLVTGDQVRVNGSRLVSAQPAAGREQTRFQAFTERGELHVVPADAAPLLSAGRLDRRLFNVTKLVEFGYDDRSRQDLPLIIGRSADGANAAAALGPARMVRELPSIGGLAVQQDKASAADFWGAVAGARSLAAGIQRIWLDGQVSASLDQSVPQVGAPQAWRAGHTGKGATVAVLDTGIDATHPDLADAVTAAKDFSDSASGTNDLFGHGTHVASTITGSGAAAQGKYAGVAPDAKLIIGKVLRDSGSGSDSGVIAGMEWAASQGAKVINMSLGSSVASDGTDVLSQALNRISAQSGALFVVAAGNSSFETKPIGSPAAADAALTVGAVSKQDTLAEFSCVGPRAGDQAIKPDLTAPGVDIVAARAKDGRVGTPGEQYATLDGTSMATPHVAGAAAILAAQHPDWKADQLKTVLMGSAKANQELTVHQQGAGRLDVARAVAQQVSATPASISNGVVPWPHTGREPIAKTISYRNDSAAPVTLTLAAEIRDPAGKPAPAGMVTVEPAQLTVPAGGQATAKVLTSTKVDGPYGVYGGAITATDPAGSTAIRTALAVTREGESYDLTIKALNRQGKATQHYGLRLVNLDNGQSYHPYDQSGTTVARLPRGRYYLDATVFSDDRTEETIIIEPELAVTSDTTQALDAREGKQVGMSVDRPGARAMEIRVDYWQQGASGPLSSATIANNVAGLFARPSRTGIRGRFHFAVSAQLAQPDGKGGFTASPYVYNLEFGHDGNVPADLHRHFRDHELAVVQSTHASVAPGKIGFREPHRRQHLMVQAPLPFALTEYYTPNVQRSHQLYQQSPGSPETAQYSTPRTLRAGTTTHERWNAAVFGPAFPLLKDDPARWAGRNRDWIHLVVPLFSDQAANHVGTSTVDSGSTTLYRDGNPIATDPRPGNGEFMVPGGTGSYRLHAEATRSKVADLTTRISTQWTFRSGTGPVTGFTPLPLLAVRFAPDLDEQNRAQSGLPFSFPVYLQRNGAESPGKIKELTMQVSYDDGARWHGVPLVPAGDRWTALMWHSFGSGFASLKASAKDADGNTVTQTIIRAYALK